MSRDVHGFICVNILIFVILQSYEGHCKCISTSDTRRCRDSCPVSRSCPRPSSCPQECTYCKTGFYGPNCVRRCKGKSHCLHDNCVLLPSGRALNCSEGCKTGWRGLSCNTNCKHPCHACDRYSGDCVGQCRDGYFGSGCSERCGENCVKCDIETGDCTGPCVAGYYGESCSKQCPENCEQCHRISGECASRASFTDYEDSVTRDKIGSHGRSDSLIMNVVCALAGVSLLLLFVSFFYYCNRKYRSSKSLWNPESKESYEPLAVSNAVDVNGKMNDSPRKNLTHNYVCGWISPKSPCSNNSSNIVVHVSVIDTTSLLSRSKNKEYVYN